jgi:putative DNA methylase
MHTWADLFTNRQLTAMTTFSDLIREVRERAVANGAEPGYADAIACYLSCVLSKTADYNCTGAVWYPNEDRPKNLFARQAIPMIWDYPEVNVLADIGGTWTGCLRVVTEAMDGIYVQRVASAHVRQLNAGAVEVPTGAVTCTDPPYYDNVGYADLSDFFYVWLRRSLRDSFPDLLATMLTPKADELVADPFRHEDADKFFEDGYTKVFARICEGTPGDFSITVFYAFKQAESAGDGDHASTGWETLLEGMLTSGWVVTATWPVRTERGGQVRDIGSNAR